MNINDRKEMVESGNIRGFYGGKKDYRSTIIAFIFSVAVTLFVVDYEILLDFPWPFFLLPGGFAFYFLNTFYVAKLHQVAYGDLDLFNKIKEKYQNDGYIFKAVGKYYLEVYDAESAILEESTHTTVFLYKIPFI